MTDGVLPAGIAGVVNPVVGVGQDGQEVVVDLGQAQPPQRGGDDGLEGRKEDSRWGWWSLLADWWSHLCDQFSVGFAAPRIISGRHGRGTL